MFNLKKVTKTYKSKDIKHTVLKDIDLNFRKNEFVSILGPSGSGKTTMLNIIGGLDTDFEGNLVINGVSTKNFKSKNWDAYRNHVVGFVFQSYNLITHQTVLKNVEMTLTLSGLTRKERIEASKEALRKVGLIDHIDKKPNQLSGGQMQRVAIARAIVNNPDILMLDEPTGALDSKTSKEVMDLLKELGEEKLIIMVTHNRNLAKEYSNRIIEIQDGAIKNDSNHYEYKEEEENKINFKNKSMNFFSALNLSFKNLLTKKGRTLITAFAGSIGIIGIALILSLSTGVNTYIDNTEKDSLANYPVEIASETFKFEEMMQVEINMFTDCNEGEICSFDDSSMNPQMKTENNYIENNLHKFKKALDKNYKNINDYVTDIKYNYNFELLIYNDSNKLIHPQEGLYMDGPSISDQSSFKELISNDDLLESQYDLIEGRMPKKENELVLLLDENNNIPVSLLYNMGLTNSLTKTKKIKTKDVVGVKFNLLLNTELYEIKNNELIDQRNNEKFIKKQLKDALELEIVGVLKTKEDIIETDFTYIGYQNELNDYVIKEVKKTEVGKYILRNEVDTEEYQYLKESSALVDVDSPTNIKLYPNKFESKEKIEDIIKSYNKKQKDEDKIEYTDLVGVLFKNITNILNVITIILVGFVAISLVVSSIMISIITYISVLERTKEIGILRSIGASKKDISRVFNAEAIIIGFTSGVIGISVTMMLNIIINKIIHSSLNVKDLSYLPVESIVILIIISVMLTFMAGLIPSKIASKQDPVKALRND